MKIFLDDNLPSRRGQRGIRRYWQYMVEGVVNAFGQNVTVRSLDRKIYGDERRLWPSKLIALRETPGFGRLGVSQALLRLDEKISEAQINSSGADVVWHSYFGNASSKVPQVYTVYDMTHEKSISNSADELIKLDKFALQKKECIGRAALIFAISQSAKEDICCYFPEVSEKKIVVTHLGVDDFFFEHKNSHLDLPKRPYFLFVGHRGGHKNFSRLLTAFFASGLSEEIDLRVISPIGLGFTRDENQLIDKYNLQNRVFLQIDATDLELRAAYQKSLAFIYPSEYEGFGLPILEALASGTLVLSSNTSSMPEVGGDAVSYFDPFRIDSMADAMQKAANLSQEQRAACITNGNKRARFFTWKRCQAESVKALTAILA
ncbi:MAG TPA: glycosyltransferase family 1 protein [Thermoflexales bacterium]|nr:glycosyltransferase family 1 protein [Thermoflexales bacterium]